MTAVDARVDVVPPATARDASGATANERRFDVDRLVRALPIKWRILSIAVLNSAVVIVLAGLIWNGANALSRAWDEVRHVRESDRLLVLLEGESARLQNLIHRYINQPNPELFAEILLVRESVLGTLRNRKPDDRVLAEGMDTLAGVTERFIDGFGELRAAQSRITHIYENDVLAPARDMAGLYSIVESAAGRSDALIWPALGKSREAFTAALVAANAYYLSLVSSAAAEAGRNLETIEQTIPVMRDLTEDDMQRTALEVLGQRAAAFRRGLTALSDQFATRNRILRSVIDGTQASMSATIDGLQHQMRLREASAQTSLDRTLHDIYREVAVIATIFMSAMVFGALLVGRSIRLPLKDLMSSMHAIVAGRYEKPTGNTQARDEIGEMARAIEVFRENAIAKHQTENELRAAKEEAETTLADLRDAQRSLIEAEKLAALGGLVAGVAHEVNNPVGISLTVASSFAMRVERFAADVREGSLRRSRLEDFITSSRDAAQQLVANLHRAGELIRSFKQVAVDRSHVELRDFDLAEATEQIAVSVRPVLRKAHIALAVEIPVGISMYSDPGSYGQVLTNLFLNAVLHAFPDGRSGAIEVRARLLGAKQVEVVIADDGVGMTEDVRRRAFDPFFTTRRDQGGTGLGLHIIHSLVARSLGGRVTLDSAPGHGTAVRLVLPRRVEPETDAGDPRETERRHG